jgi:hypothetical protein
MKNGIGRFVAANEEKGCDIPENDVAKCFSDFLWIHLLIIAWGESDRLIRLPPDGERKSNYKRTMGQTPSLLPKSRVIGYGKSGPPGSVPKNDLLGSDKTRSGGNRRTRTRHAGHIPT